MKIVLFKSFLSNKLNFEFCLISLEYNVCHLQKIPTIEAFKVFEGSNFQRTSTEVKVKVNEGEIKHSVEYFCGFLWNITYVIYKEMPTIEST